jgi:HEAT repeat protein
MDLKVRSSPAGQKASAVDQQKVLGEAVARLEFEKFLCGESMDKIVGLLGGKLNSPVSYVKYLIHKGDYDAAAKYGAIAVGPLMAKMNDRDPTICQMAKHALCLIDLDKMTEPQQLGYVHRLLEKKESAEIALRGPLIIGVMNRLLDSGNSRQAVVAALISIKDVRAMWLLMAKVIEGSVAYTDEIREMFMRFDASFIKDARNLARYYVFADMPYAVAGIDVPVSAALCGMLRCEYVRETAVKALTLRAAKEAVPSLLRKLNDDDADVCCAAMEALSSFADPIAMGPLEKKLVCAVAKIRCRALSALHKISAGNRDDKIADVLRNDVDSGVRANAARILGETASDKAVDSLIEDHGRCSREMLEKFDQISKVFVGGDYVEKQREVLFLIRSGNLEAAARKGAPAIEPLVSWLNDGVTGVGPAVVAALVSIDRDMEMIASADMDNAPDKERRKEMIKARGTIVRRMIEKLEQDDDIARSGATEVLVGIGESVVSPLIAKLGDLRDYVRNGALEVLVRIGSAAVVELSVALEKGGAGIKCAIVDALGRIGDPYAVAALIKNGSKSSNPNLNYRMAAALGKIGYTGNGPSTDALKFLKELESNSSAFVVGAVNDAREKINRRMIDEKDVTVVIARADVGYGNKPFIFGTGPLNGWDHGIAMYNVSKDEWIWAARKKSEAFEYKLKLQLVGFEPRWETWNNNRCGVAGGVYDFTPVF